MYTEVKEVVSFVCRYMYGRVPRRATGIFGADLGNYLISQFASSWDVRNPTHGANERMITVNSPDGSSKCFESSANEAGLSLSDVLSHIPMQIRIFCNPGDVYFTAAANNGVKIPIWSGELDCDLKYSPLPEYISRAGTGCAKSYMGAVGQPVLISNKPLPTDDPAVLELVNGTYVPLALEKSDEMNANLCHLQERFPYRFVFKPPYSQTYTGIDFSRTRFGSTKARPDLQTIVDIKQLSSLQTRVSPSSSTPTYDHI